MSDKEGLSVRLRKQKGPFWLSADFNVVPGERAVLMGRSGGGKSTLLRWIAGLEPVEASEGEISLAGRNITALGARSRDIGLVFQEPALFPALTVLENACFGLKVRGVGREEREKRGREWLSRVSLLSHADSKVSRLSGGEKSRVAFIRAVIWEPKLLLLDEPFAALDPSLRGVMRKELVDLHRAIPVPLLIVTHDETDIEAIATSRLVLHEETPENRLVKKSPI